MPSLHRDSFLNDQKRLETKIAELFDHGETYAEKTMNTTANNLSLLTLNSLELVSRLETARFEKETQERVARNIAAHATFIVQKSDDLCDRLEKAAIKLGYNH